MPLVVWDPRAIVLAILVAAAGVVWFRFVLPDAARWPSNARNWIYGALAVAYFILSYQLFCWTL